MVKRLLSANPSEIKAFNRTELIESIRSSEGRIILSENIVVPTANIADVTNAELAASFGADLILLNEVDLFNPVISGLTKEQAVDFANVLKHLTGRPLGVNLEPVTDDITMMEARKEITSGRKATVETFKKANQLGLDMICLTGNPAAGVSNQAIIDSIHLARNHFDGMIIAGKMHSAGVAEPVITLDIAREIIEARPDVLMIPSIGSVPGIRAELIYDIIDYAHNEGCLVMTSIGTSQEGADSQTIRRLAIDAKVAGADIQHIGDGGNAWLLPVENIYHMSVAIRGKRHTLSRMGRSVNR
ncbi:haloacid dehalogenase-like hydrolase [Aerococcaceae bacterium DSM 111020]|nr:haloacid dehalogenase-like hydrolase [Aerococcaceae bacterium DSM 111020]